MKTLFAFLIFLVSALAIPRAAFSARRPLATDIQIHGVVMDPDFKLPLAYASIGVLNKPAGTISDSLAILILLLGTTIWTTPCKSV